MKKAKINTLSITLIILALLVSGCKEKHCRYEAQYTSPAPNSSLSNGDAGSSYTLVWVCD
jgi:hypothetical protein